MDPISVATVAGVLIAAVAAWLGYPSYAKTRADRAQLKFRSERQYLLDHRPELLARAAEEFSPSSRIPGTPCLTSPDWVLPRPVPLDEVDVHFSPRRRSGGLTGHSRAAKRLLPLPFRRQRGATYTTALAADPQLRPKLFWNGISYDLRELHVGDDGAVAVDLGVAMFFDMVDVCESFAHEFSSGKARSPRSLARLVRNPFDLSAHVSIPALTWILLVREPEGTVTFLLHARDAEAVVSDGKFRHAYGGQVQPSSGHTIDPGSEAALWKSFAREFAEELLGLDDFDGSAGGPLDFSEPPLSTLRAMTDDGRLTVVLLGMVVDPLSRWPSMLAAAICNRADLKDLPSFVSNNSEGQMIGARRNNNGIEGYRLTGEVVERLCSDPLVGMSAKGCLVRIWEHREQLGLK